MLKLLLIFLDEDTLIWPVYNTCSDPVHKYKISSITQVQSEQ